MKALWQLITTFIFFTLGFVIIAGILLIITREALLWQGSRSLRKDLQVLNSLSSETDCFTEFGQTPVEGEAMYRQLRFTSSRAYVLELICTGFPDRPLKKEQRVLASYVSKMPGSAGIVSKADAVESFVGIVVFQELVKGLPDELQPWLGWISRGELIGIVDQSIVTRPLVKNPTLSVASQFGTSPVSSCEGYGFTCCDAQTQSGMGDGASDVPSCEGNCFARCLPRPLIVSWRSNPMPDWDTNILELPSGGSAEFYYVIEDASTSGPWTAQVDFGDGQNATVEGKDGRVEHTFICASSACEYAVTVTGENAQGAESAATQLTTIKVIVGSTQL